MLLPLQAGEIEVSLVDFDSRMYETNSESPRVWCEKIAGEVEFVMTRNGVS